MLAFYTVICMVQQHQYPIDWLVFCWIGFRVWAIFWCNRWQLPLPFDCENFLRMHDRDRINREIVTITPFCKIRKYYIIYTWNQIAISCSSLEHFSIWLENLWMATVPIEWTNQLFRWVLQLAISFHKIAHLKCVKWPRVNDSSSPIV